MEINNIGIMLDYSMNNPLFESEQQLGQNLFSTKLYVGGSFSYKNNWLLSPNFFGRRASSDLKESLAYFTSGYSIVFGSIISPESKVEFKMLLKEIKGQKSFVGIINGHTYLALCGLHVVDLYGKCILRKAYHGQQQ